MNDTNTAPVVADPSDGPEYPDECSAKGFHGGCIRMGCHSYEVMMELELLYRMACAQQPGSPQAKAMYAALEALAMQTRIDTRTLPNEPWTIPSWMSPPRPRIVCAALLYDDNTLVVGPRHYDTVMQAQIAQRPKGNPPHQGFIDQYGHFLTRKQAWDIACYQRQVIRRVGGDGLDKAGLFSENLY
jgi:hypothetical protein